MSEESPDVSWGNVEATTNEKGETTFKPIDDVAKGAMKPDWAEVLKQVGGTAGGGALGYALASSLMGETGEGKRKRSLWEKVLAQIIPISVGGLGAYAGYKLSKNAQVGGSPSVTTNMYPFVRGLREVPIKNPPKSKGEQDALARWFASVAKESREKQAPIENVVKDRMHNNVGTTIGAGISSSLAGLIAHGGAEGKAWWNRHKFNQNAAANAPSINFNQRLVNEYGNAADATNAKLRTYPNGEVVQSLKDVEGARVAQAASAAEKLTDFNKQQNAFRDSKKLWRVFGHGIGALFDIGGTALTWKGLLDALENRENLEMLNNLTPNAREHVVPGAK